jgi:peptidoglycan/LPS O-acetylase OafA/YrhL
MSTNAKREMRTAPGGYRPDIDGLRAVAIGAVVAFHAFPNYFKGGFVGVDIFFVISGFLISAIILRELEQRRFSYFSFYVRRIRRIFPALIVVSATVFAVGWYVLLPDEFRQLGKHLAAGAGFVSNIAFWNEAGYFDRASDTKPLLHLWSLGIEEQFYILWPLAVGLLWQRARTFVLIASIVGAVSFGLNIVLTSYDAASAFYLPVTRFWELMFGGVLAYIAAHRSVWIARFGEARSALGLMLIAVSIFWLTRDIPFPGYWALLPAIGAALIISAGPHGWINRFILGNRLMVGVGLISYSLYLWHWPVLVFAKIVKGWVLTPTERVSAIVVSLALAVVTYLLIERPFRRSRELRPAAGLTMTMGAVAAVGLVMFAGVLPSRLTNEGISKILAASADWEYPPAASRNHSLGALRYFQEGGGPYTLFLGDSNMEQYGPRIDRAIKENQSFRGAILVGNQRGCKLLAEIMAPGQECDRAVNRLNELIAAETTRAVVIVAAWMNYKDLLAQIDHQNRLAQFLKAASQAKPVYLILNTPDGEELSPRGMFDGSRLTTIKVKPIDQVSFSFESFRGRYREINRILTAIAASSGARIIDPASHLCPERRCAVFDEFGKPLYLDSSHLTRGYAAQSASYIDATLDPMMDQRASR